MAQSKYKVSYYRSGEYARFASTGRVPLHHVVVLAEDTDAAQSSVQRRGRIVTGVKRARKEVYEDTFLKIEQPDPETIDIPADVVNWSPPKLEYFSNVYYTDQFVPLESNSTASEPPAEPVAADEPASQQAEVSTTDAVQYFDSGNPDLEESLRKAHGEGYSLGFQEGLNGLYLESNARTEGKDGFVTKKLSIISTSQIGLSVISMFVAYFSIAFTHRLIAPQSVVSFVALLILSAIQLILSAIYECFLW